MLPSPLEAASLSQGNSIPVKIQWLTGLRIQGTAMHTGCPAHTTQLAGCLLGFRHGQGRKPPAWTRHAP